MNFLAHLYLSGNIPDVMVGNFIGDFVKGRDLDAVLGNGIARGVYLHREIDAFTDHHPVVRNSKQRLRAGYRHYAPVIVDIFYDHFLAANWQQYSEERLEDFAARSYNLVAVRKAIVPPRVNELLPYMMRGNWLVNYAHLDGIARALGGLSSRASFDSKMDQAIVDLEAGYSEFHSEFREFFPDLERFSTNWLSEHPLPQALA